ncbi:DUF262 domain-containing protein [Arthrobacter sp. OV608]|uniref:DUF262 domain-containing protein n=1 Tax=Arthrobacter sp. OV608 TaxID=1882768 RepID=UPI000B833C37|nr:DUF262 domain-containing protein [Arthrobacter sp. OV608]
MKAQDTKIQQLIRTDHQFVIPVYQRPYVWEEKHWDSLWTDISMAAEEAERVAAAPHSEKSPKTHFVGAIVIEPMANRPSRVNRSLVVDGQQRLTTLQILMSSAGFQAKKRGYPKLQRNLHALVFNQDYWEHPEDRPMLVPSLADREAFFSATSEFPLRSDATRGPLGARNFFDEAIAEWLDEASDPELRLEGLSSAIRNRLAIVEVLLDEKDDPQVIFENLNYEGQRLSPSDLVKNSLFRQIQREGGNADELHQKYWVQFDRAEWQQERTLGRFKRSKLDTLVSNWLVIEKKATVSTAGFFSEFREWLEDSKESASGVVRSIHDLSQVQFTLENSPIDTPTGRLIDRLAHMQISVIWPFILKLQTLPSLQPHGRDSIMDMLDSYFFRRMICRLSTKDYNQLTAELLRVVSQDGVDPVVAVRDYLLRQSASSRAWPTDSQVAQRLENYPIYNTMSRLNIRILLVGIENALRQKRSEALFDRSIELSIEHLLPQEWEQNYPLTDSSIEGKQRREFMVNRLGNLTLLTQGLNSMVGNAPWYKKRVGIQKNAVMLITSASVLQPPPDVEDPNWLDSWTDEKIQVRNDYFAKLILENWRR